MERFAFGENWTDFAIHLRPEGYAKAKESVHQLAGDLKGKTFLDVGSGSGLFAIAANALGAKKVLGFDLDPQAVSAAKNMIDQVAMWDNDIRKDDVEFKVESILNEGLTTKQFDVVYSWGVLHHTGDMYKAFEAVTKLVAANGKLIIAVYNKHFTSPIWKAVKYTYVRSPLFVKKLIIYLILLLKVVVALLLRCEDPRKRKRGMRFYNDIVDWVGGYPYEYASKSEVVEFFENQGFKLVKFNNTKGWTGCNEFIFEKV